jgi:hypothetical protein
MTARLDLIVPGLCGPLPSLDGLESAAQALVKLLSSAERQAQASGYERQLAALFGIDNDTEITSAPCSLLGHGIDPGAERWIHADPVYMQADMDHAVLFDAHALDIGEDESTHLVELFNAHFAEDGLSLVRAAPEHWFLRLNRNGIETTHIASAVGRNVNLYMPCGDDASFWRSLLNETQMLFHSSEVNARRESRGLVPINSLWLWGEGGLPVVGDADITHVYADDAFALGLARLHETPGEALPGDAEQLNRALQAGGRNVLVLKSMYWPASYGDTEAWRHELVVLMQQWLVPLVESATRNRVAVTLYPCNGFAYRAPKGLRDKLRFRFRRGGRLADYVDT